jgi:hypothetical protein
MADKVTNLRALFEKCLDANLSREMIGFRVSSGAISAFSATTIRIPTVIPKIVANLEDLLHNYQNAIR